jgi:hypothetical protein
MEKRSAESSGELGHRNKPEGKPSDLPAVFADFHNADELGRVRLNTKGTRDDFEALGIHPYTGLRLLLCDGEQLSTEGIVKWGDAEGWVAEIDWSRL